MLIWYSARAAGVVAYLLLAGSVSLGVALAGRERVARWPRFALEEVHRFVSLLAGLFLTLHVLALALDAASGLSLADLVVPGLASYRPLPSALGVVSAELLLALAVTNRLRRRLTYRFWRRAHYLNFVIWAGATVHGIAGGSDRTAPWFVIVYALATGCVVGLVMHRSLQRAGLTPLARDGWSIGLSIAGAVAALGLGLG